MESITRARTLDARPSELVDIHIDGGRIAAITPSGSTPMPNALDADGAVVLPGLWDSHVHIAHTALITTAVDVSESSPEEVVSILRKRVAEDPDADVILAFGFHAGTWGTPPTASVLDEVTTKPIAVISGDAHSFWANSAGLALAGYAGHPTGFLVENEAFAAQTHLIDEATDHLDRGVASVLERMASMGLVGVVDMQMGWAVGDWQRRAAAATPLLKVTAATYPEQLQMLIDAGFRTGDRIADRVTVGPLKIIADGSLHSRTALCSSPYPDPLPGLPHGKSNYEPDHLLQLLSLAVANGIEVAVHAIGDLAVSQVLDAFQATGARGSIEHAQFVTPVNIGRFPELGVIASVQPAHLVDDASHLDTIWPTAGAQAFPWRSLLDAGGSLVLGSDAPTSPLDPWAQLDAAVNRTHHPEQALTPLEALRASMRSTLAAGQPADLILTDATPESLLGGRFRDVRVLSTFVDGTLTHGHTVAP